MFAPTGRLLVADDGANGTSAVSPYRIEHDGTLSATQAAVSDGQTAACWITLGRDGNAFVDNAGSDAISSYKVSLFGQVKLEGNTSGPAGGKPLDNAVSADNRDLYAVIGGLSELAEYAIGSNGQLTAVGTQALPTGSEGVAAS